jgi:peptidoglycan biosynthesis protein MviN/MurJ (putative lipid II flippase)
VFAGKAREGIAYTFIASLPPLFLLAAFASPLADILANGRLRVGGLIHSLAGCLVVLAVAQLAAGLHEVGRQGLFARLDIRGPRIAALLALGVTLVVGLAAFLAFAGTDRLIGLAAAVLAGDVVAAATVILLLRGVVRPEELADRKRLGAAALAAIVMLPLVVGGRALVDVQHGNRIVDFLIIAATSALALALFALALHVSTRRLKMAA